jgi:hypothetical protein
MEVGLCVLRPDFVGSGTLTIAPRTNVAVNSDADWARLAVPLAGDSVWQATTSGTFDARSVTQIRLSVDAPS